MKQKPLLPKRLKQLYANRKTLILSLLVLFASFSLIIINFYTIRIASAVRAYINGESEFSKSQKDAFLYLSSYIQTKDEHFRSLYKDEIAVPKGDNFARVTFTINGSDEDIKKGFLMGRNNLQDLDNMIWLYKNFHSVSFMRSAIKVWEEAGPLINEADSIDGKTYMHIKEGSFTSAEQQAFITRINLITAELSKKERIFSTVLGNTARNSDRYLFWINVFCIILILGSVISYAMMMINRLSRSEKDLRKNNQELINLNKELDTFVYSASHDLRSPIASLKGLVDITLQEDEPATKEKYLLLMNGIIDRLDIFIKEIIDFFRNKRTEAGQEKVSLQKLINEAIGLVQFIPGNNIAVIKNIDVDSLYSDELRVKIILNNLISNAVKYSDLTKENRFIKIGTRLLDGKCIIEVEDNGIGIKKEYHEKIFEMFFVTKKGKGTGLGLYIVKETVEKLSGSITVKSEINKGSVFTVSLPYIQPQ